MPKGLRLLSLLLLATSAHAAVDNQIIKSEAASVITLAGRIGEAAMFSVQADDDDDLEIFATASSGINGTNDHWLLFDWDGSNYDIMARGSLQSGNQAYISSFQPSLSEIIIGHKGGQLSRISFVDSDTPQASHEIIEKIQFLEDFEHDLGLDAELNFDLKAIVNLTGTN